VARRSGRCWALPSKSVTCNQKVEVPHNAVHTMWSTPEEVLMLWCMVGWQRVHQIVEPGELRLKCGAHDLMTDDESMDYRYS
jgi:hypothetical protein